MEAGFGHFSTQCISRVCPGSVPIIYFTANAFKEDREKSLKAGMDGHIANPLKGSEFCWNCGGLGCDGWVGGA